MPPPPSSFEHLKRPRPPRPVACNIRSQAVESTARAIVVRAMRGRCVGGWWLTRRHRRRERKQHACGSTGATTCDKARAECRSGLQDVGAGTTAARSQSKSANAHLRTQCRLRSPRARQRSAVHPNSSRRCSLRASITFCSRAPCDRWPVARGRTRQPLWVGWHEGTAWAMGSALTGIGACATTGKCAALVRGRDLKLHASGRWVSQGCSSALSRRAGGVQLRAGGHAREPAGGSKASAYPTCRSQRRSVHGFVDMLTTCAHIA
jgi:hypothetical protein